MNIINQRLFADEVLYCEGGLKPYLRGKIHMVWSASALPYGVWRLYMACRGNPMRFGIAMVSLGTNMACFGWSAAFHVGSWSMPVEIALQK